MSRTPLLVAALVALGAGQLGAQEYVWTEDRPDGVAPGGVYADRVLDRGDVYFSLHFQSTDREGVRFGTGFLSLDGTFEFFDIAPLTLSEERYEARVAVGLHDDWTWLVRGAWLEKRREALTESRFFTTESEGFTDIESHLLWQIWDRGSVRAHIHGGLVIPVASISERADVPGVRSGLQPYDMQTGARTWGLIPGATLQAQNDEASVGAQVMARVYLADNWRDYRPGDALEFKGWGAYRFNDFFSVSGGVHAVAFGAIDGQAAQLDPNRDPGELALSYGGERVDVPVGLNFFMPEGPLEGHRLSIEWINNVHEELDGPWLAADDAFVVSWQTTIGN